MTGTVVIPHIFPGSKRCDYCHRPFKRLYAMKFDDYTIWVCSGNHGELARKNWEEKVKLGIKPGVPLPPKDSIESEEVDINIEELGENNG